jgi:hypothetical protein
MKHSSHHFLFAMLAVVSLCMNNIMASENKDRQPPPPPPPMEHKAPLGQQFNVRGRINALLENLRQNEPEEYQRLIKLRSQNREEYLKELWKKMPERENDNRQKIAETDRQCRKLGEKFQQAKTEQEKTDIKAELAALLEQSMELVLQDTKERLERVQAMLDHLNNNRERIIQQRLEQFLSGQTPAPPPPQEKPDRRQKRQGKPRK